uniref:Uncharacterized protein n=1 Tax=Cacopsylla melanoneura TaxID=428564 RepID=A0A8D9EGD0_9HEMI
MVLSSRKLKREGYTRKENLIATLASASIPSIILLVILVMATNIIATKKAHISNDPCICISFETHAQKARKIPSFLRMTPKPLAQKRYKVLSIHRFRNKIHYF